MPEAGQQPQSPCTCKYSYCHYACMYLTCPSRLLLYLCLRTRGHDCYRSKKWFPARARAPSEGEGLNQRQGEQGRPSARRTNGGAGSGR